MKTTIAIVVADFNEHITHVMQKKAEAHAKKLKINIAEVVHVPGAFEIPLAVKKLLQQKEIDGIVTLGAVIRGGTDHDIVVANNAARKIMDLSLEFMKPVALGISGPRMAEKDAVERIDDYAKRSVEACMKMIRILRE
ncbi:6,7-dimethyl-8-ribityllumazine synthase [Candidatus Woesearchaeota archaeon]|nr:6,7-dimethyl-8-ribityllumazine synthase [Candidatus Woesearchaeota archaeon]